MKKKLVCGLIALLYMSISLSAHTYKDTVERAFAMAEKDSLAQAEILFKEALKLGPSHAYNAIIFSRLGTIQQRLNRLDDALESYTYSLNIAPKSVQTLLDRGALYLDMGKPDQAYVDYSEVLDLDKDNMEALLFRAYISMKRRDYKAARLDYTNLLLVEPGHYNGLLGMALLNQKEKRYQEALGNYSK